MGGAFVGVADDINTLYWNPAGLATVVFPELCAMHSMYLADTKHEVIGYAQPLGPLGTMAGSISVLNYGGIPQTFEGADGLYLGQSGSSSPMDYFVNIGWGESLPPFLGMNRLKGGVTLKGAFQQLSGGTLVGLGITGGALLDTPVQGLRLGMVVDNLGGLAGRGRWLPLVWALGGSYGTALGTNFRAIYALDVKMAIDTSPMFNMGGELTAFQMLQLRAGWRGGGAAGGPSFGLGVKYPLSWFARTMIFKMDYAMAYYDELGQSQRFQLSTQFGGWAPTLKLTNVEASGERGELSLKWKGDGPAYQIYIRRKDEEKFVQLTDRPLENTHFMLTGLAPGMYVLKVMTIDPYKPEWRGPASTDIEVEVEAAVDKPLTPAPAIAPAPETLPTAPVVPPTGEAPAGYIQPTVAPVTAEPPKQPAPQVAPETPLLPPDHVPATPQPEIAPAKPAPYQYAPTPETPAPADGKVEEGLVPTRPAP
jgi:hypothetical protein